MVSLGLFRNVLVLLLHILVTLANNKHAATRTVDTGKKETTSRNGTVSTVFYTILGLFPRFRLR
jgi:hypothetical protein